VPEPSQLAQRERIALRAVVDTIALFVRQREAEQLARQVRSRVAIESAERQGRQPGVIDRCRDSLACGKHERHGFSHEAAGREQQRLQRRRVEPMRVVDQDEQRPLGSHPGQQRRCCGTDDEAIALNRRHQRERAREGVALRLWQLAKLREYRAEQLECRSESDIGLPRHSLGPQHAHVAGGRCGELQQRGLPDARVASEDERAAITRARPREQTLDPFTLDVPPHEHAARAYADRPSARRAGRNASRQLRVRLASATSAPHSGSVRP
jgi:hypothetical protein